MFVTGAILSAIWLWIFVEFGIVAGVLAALVSSGALLYGPILVLMSLFNKP